MRINNSRAIVAENCLRKYFWMFAFRDAGLTGKRLSENLAFGSLIHYIYERFYKGEDRICEAAEQRWRDEYKWEDLDEEERELWEANFEWARRIFAAYEKWAAKNDQFLVEEVEVEGVTRLGDICYKCGRDYVPTMPACIHCGAEIHDYVWRADLVVTRFGGLYVIDHKTAQSTGDIYHAQWNYSPQLRGYAYCYGKDVDKKVHGTCASVTKKLKTVGIPGNNLKRCPECRGGSRKKSSCTVCEGRGKVEREKSPDDSAFEREWSLFDDDQGEDFLRLRLRTIEDIQREERRFEVEPDAAWPRNPDACFARGQCPFVELCYGGDPATWYDPIDEALHPFQARPEDYVTEEV